MGVVNNALMAVFERLQEHERRLGGQELRGPVTHVDPAKKLCRVALGKDEDGNDVLSPWRPYKQTAGALKFHNPPSIGQSMILRSESGDLDQAVAEPYHWSDENPSPSDDGGTHKMTFGAVTATLTSDALVFDVGGVSVRISGDGLAVTGGQVTHNGHDIGDTHKHTEVEPGGGLSGPPA